MRDQVICRLKDAKDPWPFEESGDWSADNRVGGDAAEELIHQMNSNDNPTLLGRVAKSMIKRGEYNGTHVGFFHRISERLMP